MHFFFLIKRCLVLLSILTVVSSMSHEICQKLRNQQEKIRVLGEVFGSRLLIYTTSGHLFPLKVKSTLVKHSTEGYYYLNISQEPDSHVDKEWPNVKLDLSENKNKLYAMEFVHYYNLDSSPFIFSMFKTKTGNWKKSLYSHKCKIELDIGRTASDVAVDTFKDCNSKTVNENEDAFMVSRSVFSSSSLYPITFVKSGANRYDCFEPNHYCFQFGYFMSKSDDTVLAAAYLNFPFNILLFIYTSGTVEIRKVDIHKKARASNSDWTVPIRDFIQCAHVHEATSQSILDISSTQRPQTSPTTDDVPGLWHTHTWRILIVAVLLVLNGICLALLYWKRCKRKNKRAGKSGKYSKVKKRKNSPNRSSIGPNDSLVDNSITGTRRRAESLPTGSPIIRKNKKKVTKCPSSISKSSTPKGSTIKAIGSTLTIRTESGFPLANESKGSSIQKKPFSEIESTPPPATVSNPSNVNSKASAKLSLAKKKQATGKWMASFLWAKKRNKRNDKKKPKDTKKDNEKK